MDANIFSGIPARLPDELFETLIDSGSVLIERIVSLGHITPQGQWYDQERDEWVLLLSGAAELLLAGESAPRKLVPGDHVLIPAHCRHRVTWTEPERPTLWLAVHFEKGVER